MRITPQRFGRQAPPATLAQHRLRLAREPFVIPLTFERHLAAEDTALPPASRQDAAQDRRRLLHDLLDRALDDARER